MAVMVRAEATHAARRHLRAHLQGFVKRLGRVGLRSGILVVLLLGRPADGLGMDWACWKKGRHLFVLTLFALEGGQEGRIARRAGHGGKTTKRCWIAALSYKYI